MALQDDMCKWYSGTSVAGNPALNIARGTVAGYGSQFKFGINPDVGTTRETIWEYGGLYETPETATIATLVSSSTSDTSGGTGAQIIYIEGLDADYNFQSELVALSGTTVVSTSNTYIRLNRAYVVTAGTGGYNVGTIVVSVDAKVVTTITPGRNQSQVAHYTIPENTTGYLTAVFFDTGSGKEAEVSIWARTFGGVYRNVATSFIYQSIIDADFTVPRTLPAKTDIELRAKASQSSTEVGGSLTLILEDTDG